MTMRDGVYVYPERDRVVFGRPAVDTLIGEIERRSARRAFVIASNSLAQASGVLEALPAKPRDRLAGSWTRIGPHTPPPEVVAPAPPPPAAHRGPLLTIDGGPGPAGGQERALLL